MKIDDFEFLVEYAVKAPSGHNTQPWKYENTEDGVIIHPDFSRALPVVDKENYELYISLGCALENLIIAATHRGYEYNIQYPDTSAGSIYVKLEKGTNIKPDEMFDYIVARQVSKGKYDERPVSTDDLQLLSNCFNYGGVSMLILNGRSDIQKLVPLIIEASDLQFGNKDFVNELVSWCRYSKNEAARTNDGIWSATMGMPGLGRFLGSMIMKNLITTKSEAKRITNLLRHTQGLVVFVADNNDTVSWVKTGRAFQRFGLLSTKLGISHAHLNMPCEEKKIRRKLAKALKIETKHPLLLIRYGYSDKMPYSFRRPINEVIIN